MVRYAGLFCNRWKKYYLNQARRALRLPVREKRENLLRGFHVRKTIQVLILLYALFANAL